MKQIQVTAWFETKEELESHKKQLEKYGDEAIFHKRFVTVNNKRVKEFSIWRKLTKELKESLK